MEAVELLLAKGVENSINLVWLSRARTLSKGVVPGTPLHWAAAQGDLEIVEVFIKAKADVNSFGQGFATPLIYAAAAGYDLVVKRLCQAGADRSIRSTAQWHYGLSALQIAQMQGYTSISEILLR